jgi:MoxR-like ATPase
MGVREIVKAAYFTPTKDGWGLPLAFEAGPGTAKSSILEDIAVSCGLPCVVLAPGERGEGSFGAVPVPEKNKKDVTRLTYPAPEWVDDFPHERGVLFLDELTTAPPALQPAMLGLLLARRIGGTQLPVGIRPIAAYNAPEDAAAGYDLPKPTANRLGHIKWDAGSADDWADHMMGCGAGLRTDSPDKIVDPKAEEERVLAAWGEAFGKAKGIVTSFIRRFPAKLHVEPKSTDPNASRAWASRRTWEFATRAIAAAEIHNLSEMDRDELIAGFVGPALAIEFTAFIREQDMPDPIAILDGKVEFDHDPTRLDRSIAVLTSCAAIVVPEDCPDRDKRAERLWEALNGVVKKGAKDVAFMPARILAKNGFIRIKASRPVLGALAKVLEAAGIQAG